MPEQESLPISAEESSGGASQPAQADDLPGPEQYGGAEGKSSEPPEPESKPEAKPETKSESPPELKPELLERAKALGMSAIEARSFANESALTIALDVVERETTRRNVLQEARPAEIEPKKEPEEEWKNPVDGILDFDANEVGERHAKAFNALRDVARVLAETVHERDGQLQSVDERTMAVLGARREQLFDEWANGLDDHELLGKGSAYSLDQKTPEWKNRAAVFDHVMMLEDAYRTHGKKAPLESALFEQAYYAVLGGKIRGMARRDVERKIEEQKKQRLHRSSSDIGASAKSETESFREKLFSELDARGVYDGKETPRKQLLEQYGVPE